MQDDLSMLMAITTKIKGKTTKRVHPTLLKRRDGYVEVDKAGNNIIRIRRWLQEAA